MEKSSIGTNSKDHDQSSDVIQLVSFTLANEEFGIDIALVEEINRPTHITRVPNAPEFVVGVINLRGKVIPIIDLRKRFGMQSVEMDKSTRIIVVEVKSKTVGFIVDSVREVRRIPLSVIEPPPPLSSGVGAEYIKAVGNLEDCLLILLNLEIILAPEELALVSN